MLTSLRLTQTYKSSPQIQIDDKSKIVFFSDVHRGDKTKADNFAPNKDIYISALNKYYDRGFTYIELGDGDELWENDNFSTIFESHRDVFLLLKKFYIDQRLHMIWGNHDVYKKSNEFVKDNLYKYYDLNTKSFKTLFEGIEIPQGLILKYSNSIKIFVLHGHQGDIINDSLWPVAKFLNRYLWKYFEKLSYENRCRDHLRLGIVEENIVRWAQINNLMLITGHTHIPIFANPGDIPYFNDGSCVNDNYITCIEIQNGKIILVKWYESSNFIIREVIEGPKAIVDYF